MVCEADELVWIDLRPCIVCDWDVEVDGEAKSDGKPDELMALESLGWGGEVGEECWENGRLRPGVGSLKLKDEEAEATRFFCEGSSCMRRRGLFRRRRASLIRSDAPASV